ncbi:uncharacterized protein LACBIDRAFT_313106 [Laccaria bicolor S238N-H82]|uniref:Predicted protein n=1 Tax=Laccaria bicolor (strain S238N-H82 / ATCC MYA-4686) TaxID=486041 RepID=B0DXJ7_LACBS|nr:uncharacterized protein LACBIDRAFT_313106 [Laccaria bicolor S238N-H82]EDR00690.1 predicted protein [Laccaria bicolor S238N-H82]|eukprot:XP_001888699.1 predicted protein [Laccaria bicolor S238N-H82]
MLSRHASASSSSRKLVSQRFAFALARSQPRRLVSQPSLTYDHLTSSHSTADLASPYRSGFSNLGLRSSKPPDSIPDSDPKTSSEIPDQDWELRTGRAIYVLQQTLPDFFATGLITSIDKRTGAPVAPSTSIPIASANPLDDLTFDDDAESIYSPFVQSFYTPPVPLPAPFPKTLHVEGLQLYLACLGFVRHTMNTLYSDLAVVLTKVVVNAPSPPTTKSLGGSAEMGVTKRGREKSLLVRQNITGIARVSGKPGEWIVESTYTFSPSTGLIYKYVINVIRPAPHVAVYESLRASMGKLLGLGHGGGSAPSPNGAACKGAGKV